MKWALVYGSIFCFNTAINGIIHQPYYHYLLRQGMRIRLALSGLIYRKQLRSCENNIGDILKNLSSDAVRIEYGILFIPYIIVSPLQVIAIILLLLKLVDLSFLSGIILLFLTIPLQSIYKERITAYKYAILFKGY